MEMSAMTEDLLIDQVYRSCFDKKRPRPALRAMLESARRFVLDNEMSAFLADLNFQTFTGRWLHIKPHRRRMHFCRGIDSVRHFARLPHRVTWVEFSSSRLYGRTKEILRDMPPEERALTPIIGDDPLMVPPPRPVDILREEVGKEGFLCWQHDKIETAFSARPWVRQSDGESGSLPVALMWNTEDGPLPWRQSRLLLPVCLDLGITPSEWVLMGKGYIRDNVGFRSVAGDLDTPHYDDTSPRMYQAQEYVQARMQILWSFLSTLNKIPLVGERKIVRSHGFIARGRYRRFLEHSVITLTIPAKADPRKVAKGVLSELRRRAHQVRGHWRDDWHQPKGNKALWIAEHQRGDASLGFVTHDYSVQHRVAK